MKNNHILNPQELEEMLESVFSVPDSVFPLKITGSSMVPFLANQRDTAILSPPRERYKKGDIIFYKRSGGRLILHRIVKIRDGELYLAGDAQTYVEGPLSRDCVIAYCGSVIRKGKKISDKNILWKLYAAVWTAVLPLRKKILLLYSEIR